MKETLKSVWWLIINIGYLIAILLLGLFLFTVPSQSDDFVYAFAQDFEPDYVLAVYLSLPFWCWVTWYSGCIILQIDPIQPSLVRQNRKVHRWLSLLVPRIAGILPCIILLVAIAFVPNVTETKYQFLHVAALSLLAAVMWILFTVNDRWLRTTTIVSQPELNRTEASVPSYDHPKGLFAFLRYLIHVKAVGDWPSPREVIQFKQLTNWAPTIAQELIFIWQFRSVRTYFVKLGAVALVLTVVFCFPSANLFLSSWLRPASILIITIPCLTLLFTIVFYFHNYTRRPFGIILLVVVIAFSYWNDNTFLEYKSNDLVSKRKRIDVAFDEWLLFRRTEWKKRYPGATMPVIFIATQGGGIRALNWT
ncbi:MAG TPA: hypothetical protein VIL31_16255, partial [Cyclobacteriaceae bacterium]